MTFSAKDNMPKKGEYVLIQTPYCKYPATVGFWNGLKWLDSERTEIFNVDKWQYISFE